MKIKSLVARIGEEILVAVSGTGAGKPQRARLHLVEDQGVWLEGQKIVESLFSAAETAPQTIFVPFAQIQYITEVAEIEPATRSRFKR